MCLRKIFLKIDFLFPLLNVSEPYAVTKVWCIGVNHAWYGTPGGHPLPGAKGFNACPSKNLNKILFDKVVKHYSSGEGKKHLCNMLDGSDFNNPNLKVWFELAVEIKIKCKENLINDTKIVIKEDKESKKLAEQEKQKRIELERKLAVLEKKQKEPQNEPKTIVANKPKSEFPLKPIPINFPTVSVKRDDIAVIIGNANYKKQGKDIPNVNPAYADAEGIKQYH